MKCIAKVFNIQFGICHHNVIFWFCTIQIRHRTFPHCNVGVCNVQFGICHHSKCPKNYLSSWRRLIRLLLVWNFIVLLWFRIGIQFLVKYCQSAMSTRILQFIILNNVLVENSKSDPTNYFHLHLQDSKGGRFWWIPRSWCFNIGAAASNEGDLKNQESQNLVGSRIAQNGRFIRSTFFTKRIFDPSASKIPTWISLPLIFTRYTGIYYQDTRFQWRPL